MILVVLRDGLKGLCLCGAVLFLLGGQDAWAQSVPVPPRHPVIATTSDFPYPIARPLAKRAQELATRLPTASPQQMPQQFEAPPVIPRPATPLLPPRIELPPLALEEDRPNLTERFFTQRGMTYDASGRLIEDIRSAKLFPLMPDHVAFAEGLAVLDAASMQRLRRIAAHLQQHPDLRLELRGFADPDQRSPSETRRLSLQRTLAIRRWLAEQAIAETRITLRPLGPLTATPPRDRVDLVLQGEE